MSQGWTGKRKASRMTTHMLARAVSFDGGPAFDVVVTDLSASGARLECPADASLPEEFNLELMARGETHIARIRWRQNEVAGVEFMPARSAHSLESVLVRLDAVERRLAGLESAPGGHAGGADHQSPILDRIAALEARHLDAGPALETEPETEPETETEVADRLTRIEWRLTEIGNQVDAIEPAPTAEPLLRLEERIARLEAAVRSATAAPDPVPAPAPAHVMDPELAERVAQLEARMRDGLVRLRNLEARPAPEAAQKVIEPAPDDLAREVAELKAGVEALVIALSMGFARAAA